MRIKTYKFKDDNVNVKVPFDGLTYINATEVYQAFGKKQTSFDSWKTRTLIPYAEKLIELGKIPTPQNAVLTDSKGVTISDIIIVRKGGKTHEAGTWFHPKLAVVFARWLSMEFEIWCDEKITELLETGAAEIKPADQVYLDLKNKVYKHLDAGDRSFVRAVRRLLATHESEGHNIKVFEEFMQELGKKADTADRLQAYMKVNKVIEEMYQEGELDITTREKMKKLCQTCIDRIRSRRLSVAEAKIKELQEAKVISVDKATHDEMVALSVEVVKAKEQAETAQLQSNGIAAQAMDDGLHLFNFSSEVVGAKEIAEMNMYVDGKGYRKLFNSTLLPKEQVEGKKYPACVNDQHIVGYGILSAAVWEHPNSSFVRLTSYNNYGIPGTITEISMFPVNGSSNYRGTNSHKTLCAVYNKTTKYLIVYGIPAEK